MGNPVVQWQIVAKDPEAETKFYASLFGWQIRTNNALGYRMVETQSDRGINGGVWPSPPEGHNLVQLFVAGESARARRKGDRAEVAAAGWRCARHRPGSRWSLVRDVYTCCCN